MVDMGDNTINRGFLLVKLEESKMMKLLLLTAYASQRTC